MEPKESLQPHPLFPRIRSIIYVASICIALVLYGYASTTFTGHLVHIRLEEYYGFLSFIYIYFALLPSPLYAVFPELPGKKLYTRARRAIGVSSFCFAFLHSSIAFFMLLGGVQGIPFLSGIYLLDFVLAAIALLVLFLLAATSFDYAVNLMGPWWKRLHRLLYLAGFFILAHVFIVGADFFDPTSLIPSITVLAVAALLLLEAARIDRRYFAPPEGSTLHLSWFMVLSTALIAGAALLLLTHGLSLGIHAS